MMNYRWRLPGATTLLVVIIAVWGWLALPFPGAAAPALTCPPVAPTQYFTFVYGSVQLNGSSAAAGTIVEARSPRGDTVGCAVVETAGLYPLMYIYGEETLGGQTTPGMRTNEAVSFYVNGIAATPSPAFNWVNSWQSTRVDLAATGNNPPPVADFTASPTTGVAPLAVQFTDVSTGTITSRSWSFGDSGTSTAQNPSYSFTTPGVYTVTLTVTGPGGSDTKTRVSYITVNHPPPVADFTASPTSGVAPLTVQFTDVSTGTITSRSWSFGDGGTSTAQNPSYTFTTPGVYTVALTVTGPGGSNTKTMTSYISVSAPPNEDPPPVADFSAEPTSGIAPLTVQFTDVSSGTITSHAWTFGDGGTSTAQNPSYTYAAAGVYTVTLTVTGPGGSDTITRASYITVNQNVEPPSTPVASFIAAPGQGTAPLFVRFTDTSTGAVTSWVWSFGNGANSSERHPAYTYTVAGVYTVTLNVNGPHGWSSAAQPVHVAPPLPTFSHEPAPAEGLTVHFTFDPPPGVTHWLWEFGDGETSTAQNPVYTYAAPGDYVVRLTVYTAGGLSSTYEKVVQVQEIPIQAEFNLYLPAVTR